MKKWRSRPNEISYLFNPAFCGRIIYHAIHEYKKEENKGLPFPLVYLILPLILNKKVRKNIDSKTKMQVWIKRNQEVLVEFPERTKDLVEITNESLEFLLSTGIISINEDGRLDLSSNYKALSKTKFTDEEIKECIVKSANLARWFARGGTVETIYIAWGVRP